MRGEILLAILLYLAVTVLSLVYAWRQGPNARLWQKPRWLLLILFLAALTVILLIQVDPVLGLSGWAAGMALTTGLARLIWLRRQPKPTLRLIDWPLAAGLILATRNKWPIPMEMTGGPLSPKTQKNARRYLRKDWEIETEEDWRETADWLLEEGQRLDFQNQIDNIRRMTEEERTVLRVQIDAAEIKQEDQADQAELQARLLWIEAAGEELQQGSFMGWDMLRLIDLTRWALRAELINEEIATTYLLAASQALQHRCNSWEEAQEQYLKGLRFWSAPTYEAQEGELKRLIGHFVQSKKSPWKSVPWELEIVPPTEE